VSFFWGGAAVDTREGSTVGAKEIGTAGTIEKTALDAGRVSNFIIEDEVECKEEPKAECPTCLFS
jgi:hypothetical protein